MLKYYFAAFLSVFLTAISQLLFKLGANYASRRSVFFVYINPYSLSAYTILLAVTLLSVYAYTKLPVKLAVVLLPFTYILVGLFSFLFLKEKITRTQLIGTGIIIMGICIFGSAGIAGSCSWSYGKNCRPEQAGLHESTSTGNPSRQLPERGMYKAEKPYMNMQGADTYSQADMDGFKSYEKD